LDRGGGGGQNNNNNDNNGFRSERSGLVEFSGSAIGLSSDLLGAGQNTHFVSEFCAHKQADRLQAEPKQASAPDGEQLEIC